MGNNPRLTKVPLFYQTTINKKELLSISGQQRGDKKNDLFLSREEVAVVVFLIKRLITRRER